MIFDWHISWPLVRLGRGGERRRQDDETPRRVEEPGQGDTNRWYGTLGPGHKNRYRHRYGPLTADDTVRTPTMSDCEGLALGERKHFWNLNESIFPSVHLCLEGGVGGQQGSPRRTCRPCVCVNCLHVRVCRQNLCMSAFFCRLCLYMFCSSRVWSFRALPVLDRHAPLGQLTQQLFSCRGPASVWALIWEKMRDSPVVSLGENYIERFF